MMEETVNIENYSIRNYEEKERISLFDAITAYLVRLNESRALLHTLIYTKRHAHGEVIQKTLFDFRFWFRQLYDFTMPLVFPNSDPLKTEIDDWFSERVMQTETERTITKGIELSLEYQNKLKSFNLMPIQTSLLKPPFDLTFDEKEEEEEV